MKAWALLSALLMGVTFGPQDDVKTALADIKKSIDAMAKDLAEVKATVARIDREVTAAQSEAKIKKTHVLIRQIETACEIFEKEQNVYPADGVGELVKGLVETMGARGLPYMGRGDHIKDGNFIDAWGNPIQYQNNATDPPPEHFHNQWRIDLYSFGPNGKDDKGEADDITNWR